MALRALSTSELQKELHRREKSAHKLQARRAKLLKELAEVEEKIGFLEGSTNQTRMGRFGDPGTARRRARNDMTLPDAICAAMEVRAIVTPKEASDLVLANGFQTTSKNFNMMVSNALAKDTRFKRIGRGQYERVR
ncbi:MAG: hypothetical protein P8N09_00070 [Planctomycetota bacterium]|jgi:hypothetical protein|nr:hypothetical protein [Planctomycetota bacterium]